MIFNVLKANTLCKELSTKLEDADAQIKQLTESVESYKQKEAAFSLGSQDWMTEKENLISGHAEAIKALQDNLEKSVKEANNKTVEAETKTAAKAAELVASLGVEPETVKKSSDELLNVKKSRYTTVSHLPK